MKIHCPERLRERPWRRVARALAGATLLLLAGAVASELIGCQATKPNDDPSPGDLSVALDVIPLIMPADTTQAATVWVTVMAGAEPVADSTRVRLVASAGSLPTEVLTSDGMAITSYRPSLTTGVVTIIAQVHGVRDTMNITVY